MTRGEGTSRQHGRPLPRAIIDNRKKKNYYSKPRSICDDHAGGTITRLDVEFPTTALFPLMTDIHSIEGADMLPWARQFNSTVELAFTA